MTTTPNYHTQHDPFVYFDVVPQKEYKKQLMKDVASVVRSDPNYSAEKFPRLADNVEGR